MFITTSQGATFWDMNIYLERILSQFSI